MAQVGPAFSQINMIEMSNRAREQVGERPRKARKPRRQRFPMALERQYAARIKEVVEIMRKAVNEILVPILPDIIREAKSIRKDDYTDTLARAIELIGTQTVDQTGGAAGLASFIEEHGAAVSKFNKAEVISIMRGAVGVDIFLSDPALLPKLRGFATVNAGKIDSIAKFRLPEIERLVLQEIENGTRVEVLRADIQKQFKVDRSKADLLARDQTSKLNGDLTKLRQVEAGVQDYKWRTVGDDAVRDNHASKEGVTFKWSDPPAETGHPGQDFQCRCYAEPIIEI